MLFWLNWLSICAISFEFVTLGVASSPAMLRFDSFTNPMPVQEADQTITQYPPGPRHSIPLVTYVRAYRDPLGFLMRTAREFPDIAFMKLGRRHDYIISSPDYVRDVLIAPESELLRGFNPLARKLMGNGLLSSQGELHRRQRKLLLPLFDRRQLATFSGTMVEHCLSMSRDWSNGVTRDIAEDMLDLSFDIMADILFGAREEKAEALRAVIDRAVHLTGRMGHARKFLDSKLHIYANNEPDELKRHLDELILGWMNYPANDDGSHPTLVARLREAQSAANDPEIDCATQTRDEAITLLLAGHETTATALAWTWYLLSKHPDVEQLFHVELDEVLTGRTPTIQEVPRLKYTAAVFCEAMRLYPPVWLLARRPIQDWQLGSFTIPARSFLYVSPFAVHRDPRYFDQPEVFDPSRWTSDQDSVSRHKFSYIPFGAAGRKCIGENFAMIEGVLILAAIGQKWKLRLAEGQRVRMDPLMTLRPKYGMRMTVESRQS
jgi:cytochrome P450